MGQNVSRWRSIPHLARARKLRIEIWVVRMNLRPPPRRLAPAWRERFEERAAIMEFQANLSREIAEYQG